MSFSRNGLNFIDENEFNQWAINEVIIIMDNTDHLYKAYQSYIKNNMNRSLSRIIRQVMQDCNMKVKEKNIKAVMSELKENYKTETEQ